MLCCAEEAEVAHGSLGVVARQGEGAAMVKQVKGEMSVPGIKDERVSGDEHEGASFADNDKTDMGE